MNNTVKRKNKNAYVIFTREPVPGATKTRLMPYYSAEKCAEIHRCFLSDMAQTMKKANADIIIAYTGGEPVFLRKTFGEKTNFIEQRGNDLGKKMENSFADAFDMGYDRVVLTGTDIPELKADTVNAALDMLDDYDVVLGPTADGGYYLIAMSRLHSEPFNVKLYGVSTVFEETTGSIRESGLTVGISDEYSDIDDRRDIAGLMKRVRENGSAIGHNTKQFLRDNMAVSVIIPVLNESKIINSILDQLRPYRDDAEIIFVDGSSSDETASLIGEEFRLVKCEAGRGIQMNTGAMAATGDVLFFLHSDSVLPEGFLDDIRRCMMRAPYGCFGLRFSSHNLFMLTNRFISNHRAFSRGIPFCDQGIFIDRDLFFEMGAFPEYKLMEDYEFSLRMRRRGYRPAMTKNRILSSSRRYGKSTASIMKMEAKMWLLRRLYRLGADPARLNEIYKDIR